MAEDCYSVEILGTIAGQPAANVLHFKGVEETSPDPVSGAKALIAALGAPGGAATYIDSYLNCLPDNYFLKGVRVRRVNNSGGPNVAHTFDNDPGNRAGSADVSGVGPVGLWHAQDAAEKWVTGKIFFPGVSVDDVAENVFEPALVLVIQVFQDLFTGPIGAGPEGPWTQVVWSPTALVALEIIASSVSAKVGTQRRRYVPL